MAKKITFFFNVAGDNNGIAAALNEMSDLTEDIQVISTSMGQDLANRQILVLLLRLEFDSEKSKESFLRKFSPNMIADGKS